MGFEINGFLLVYSIHLPDASLLHPMCSMEGHWHKAQLHPWGQQKTGLIFSQEMCQVNFFCAHWAYFYPKVRFPFHVPAACPRAACRLCAAPLLLLSPNLSPPCSSISCLFWDFSRGCHRLPKFPLGALLARAVAEASLWSPCAVPGSAGWGEEGWLWALLVPVPKNCSEAEGRSRQVAKTHQGRRKGHSQLVSTEGFLTPGSFLGSESTDHLCAREG